MSIKDILVHASNDDAAATRLDAAANIAAPALCSVGAVMSPAELAYRLPPLTVRPDGVRACTTSAVWLMAEEASPSYTTRVSSPLVVSTVKTPVAA